MQGREARAGFDAVECQVLTNAVARGHVRVAKHDGKHPVPVCMTARSGWDVQQVVQVAEAVLVPAAHTGALAQVVLNALHLRQAHGRLQVGEPVVEAEHRVEIGAVWVLPLIPVQADLRGQLGAVACDHAALTRGEGLVAEERERGDVAVATHVGAANAGANGLGGVLHDDCSLWQRLAKRRDVNRHAVQVNRDDGLGARSYRGGHGLRGDIEGGGVGIHQHHRGPHVRHGVGAGHVGHRGHNHLVAGPDALRHQCQVEGSGAITAGDGVLYARPLGKGIFKALDVRPLRRHPLGGDAVGHVLHLVPLQIGVRDSNATHVLVLNCHEHSPEGRKTEFARANPVPFPRS